MKKTLMLSVFAMLTIVSMYAFSSNANPQNVVADSVAKSSSSISDSKIIVYYFYTTARCASCHKIEEYTKQSLEKYFFDEITSGAINFQMINIDKPQNKHFIQDYQLYTKSVVLSKISDGKEVKFKNLDKVWNFLRNKNKFYEYIKEETNNFIN